MGAVEPYDRLGEEMSERRMVIFEFGFEVERKRVRNVVGVRSRGGENDWMFRGG